MRVSFQMNKAVDKQEFQEIRNCPPEKRCLLYDVLHAKNNLALILVKRKAQDVGGSQLFPVFLVETAHFLFIHKRDT